MKTVADHRTDTGQAPGAEVELGRRGQATGWWIGARTRWLIHFRHLRKRAHSAIWAGDPNRYSDPVHSRAIVHSPT